MMLQALLRENARHAEIAQDHLRQMGFRWDGKKVVRIRGAGPKGEGRKRQGLSEDVERTLKRLSAKDGKPWDTRRSDKVLLARIRERLAWVYDSADLTDAKLRDLVGNAQRREAPTAEPRRRRKPPK